MEVVSLSKPEEEEVKPKTEEIPKIEVVVKDKEAPVEEVPKTSVYTLRSAPKTRVVKKKNIIIKNLLQNIDKTTLNKYFNVWKNAPQDEKETVENTNKKTVVKKRIINLQKKTNEGEEEVPKDLNLEIPSSSVLTVVNHLKNIKNLPLIQYNPEDIYSVPSEPLLINKIYIDDNINRIIKRVDNLNKPEKPIEEEIKPKIEEVEEKPEEERKVLRGKPIKREPEKPVEEEVKPKTDEIAETPKIEVVVLDKPVEEENKPKVEDISVPTTTVYNITKKPKTFVVKKRNIIIKHLIEDVPNNDALNKYFNIWKHKKLPEDEVEKIIKENKKKIVKRRIINLQKKINEEVPKEEEPEEETPKEKERKILRGKTVKKEPEKPVEEEVKPKTEEVETPKIEVVSLSKPEEIPKIEVVVKDKEKPDEILVVGAKTIEKPAEEEVKPKTEEVETPKIEVVTLEKPVEEVPKMEVV